MLKQPPPRPPQKKAKQNKREVKFQKLRRLIVSYATLNGSSRKVAWLLKRTHLNCISVPTPLFCSSCTTACLQAGINAVRRSGSNVASVSNVLNTKPWKERQMDKQPHSQNFSRFLREMALIDKLFPTWVKLKWSRRLNINHLSSSERFRKDKQKQTNSFLNLICVHILPAVFNLFLIILVDRI